MIGLFWNIRGLGQIGRIPALIGRLRENHVDFVGIMETKKSDFTPGLLRSLTGNIPFSWSFLKAKGTAGGILVGANADMFNMSHEEILDFSVSVMLTNKVTGFSFKLVVVYDSAYENSKHAFLDELEKVMGASQGPIMIGDDYNLVRSINDKSNGLVN